MNAEHEARRDAHPEIRAGRALAARHGAEAGGAARLPPLLERLNEVAKWIPRAFDAARKAEPETLTAAEWLLDNDYQIRRALRQLREDMSPAFLRRLPALMQRAPSEPEGTARVHALAHGLLAASNLQLSLPVCARFLRAYQEGAPLRIAELWAFPTMLRAAALEILIDAFATLFPDTGGGLERLAAPAAPIALDPGERVARAVATLSAINTIAWRDLFDATSLVEEILARDPAGVYPQMTFRSRDACRAAVESIAERAGRDEWALAEQLVRLCAEHRDDPLRGHVGWWLVDAGRSEFERRAGVVPTPWQRMRAWSGRHVGPLYAMAIAIAWAGALALPAWYLWNSGAGAGAWVAGVALSVLPASVLGLTLVNWLITLNAAPRQLLRLDFRRAIAPDCRTAVVIPALVGDRQEVEALARRLEAHRLSNADPAVQFVLLSDLPDAPQARVPGDDAVETALVEAIDALNARYGDGRGGGPFHLLHRAREHNAGEGCWMGWERKRGKLEQFNRLVLSGDRGPFLRRAGDTQALRRLRFVVTADSDTILPPDSVSRMVATLAHPLNTARFDPADGRVTRGYTVLQPRVEIVPEAERRTLFSRLYAGDTSIDIYSRAVSDVYQDLFGEGSFTGKGIYEVASFTRSLEGRVPENRILSHDLFEGLHGRAGLVSDIVVYESFPAAYPEHAARLHRWIRGDWQLIAWLGRRVPGEGGGRLDSRFTPLGRWKLIDNLRRSLVAPALLALVLAGWLGLPGNPWVWTLLALLVPGAQAFTDLVTGLARGRRRGAMRGALMRMREHAGRWALAVVFLVNDAAIALDAMVRTLWRLARGRHLLEWTPAARLAQRDAARRGRMAVWGAMWIAPAIALGAGGAIWALQPAALPAAAALLALWFLAPEIARFTARPGAREAPELDAQERAYLRRIARRTWLFFETFVRPEDNWLPPDNYQEAPASGVAHRTSPTNIGMLFLASLTAWRLGHQGLPELIERSRNTLDTMDRLTAWRGHLLNWYETRHLEPLPPRYVSAVDSGNLAVSLIAFARACHAARKAPLFGVERWYGLEDTLALLAEALRAPVAEPAFGRRGQVLLDEIREAVAGAARDRGHWAQVLETLQDVLLPRLESELRDAIGEAGPVPSESLREVQIWLERTRGHIRAMWRDHQEFEGWRSIAARAPQACHDRAAAVLDAIPAPPATAEAGAAFDRARARLMAAGTLLERDEEREWIESLDAALERAARGHARMERALRALAARARDWALGMDFEVLLDPLTKQLFIGYDVEHARPDANRYDLLASEARLASYFAIAKRDLPVEHWTRLGRPLTGAGALTLLSWNGSMFEYLMPRLLLRCPPETLLGQSERAAIDVQRDYGRRHGVPWGVSESGFSAQDPDRKYRYRAFGVPGLGVRRGLARDMVVAPYATMIALPLRPYPAIKNLRALEELGALGRYGFFEAVDFTAERIPVGARFESVRSYMAHHQGMGLAALGNALCDDMLVGYFHDDEMMRTVEHLLSERIPWELPREEPRREDSAAEPPALAHDRPALAPWGPLPAPDGPGLHAISNTTMTLRADAAGSLGLWWHRHLLTRGLGGSDAPGGAGGCSVYLQDRDEAALWGLGPAQAGGDEDLRVVFHQHLVETHLRNRGIAMSVLDGICPGDDIAMRRVSLVNETDRPRRIRLTSAGEVILAPVDGHERHPAFSRLFVASDHLPDLQALLFTRRGRRPEERHPVILHRMVCDDDSARVIGFETDRRTFLGRYGSADRPAALCGGEGLSGTTGWTLDPVCALQAEVTLAPHGHAELAFVTIAAESRARAERCAWRFATLSTLDWSFEAAGVQAARSVQRLGLAPASLPAVQGLLSHVLRPGAQARPDLPEAGVAEADASTQHDLWAHGISGDAPILLLRVGEGRASPLTEVVLAAHGLWRAAEIEIDLVLLHEGVPGYVEPVRERVLGQIRDAGAHELVGHRGGVHPVARDPARPELAAAVERAASVTLDAEDGTIEAQLERLARHAPDPPELEPLHAPERRDAEPVGFASATPANGYGDFDPESGDYLIEAGPESPTPAPWANVLANPGFGTIVTEAGLGWSWALNSGENRLTPWLNDPVADPQVEALYLRDEGSSHVWTPTPRPAGAAPCRVRHGPGSTVWESHHDGLDQRLTAFVACDEPVKLVRLSLRNTGAQTRRISATYYAEWLLAALPGRADPFLCARFDPGARILTARNTRNPVFAGRVAFLAASMPPHGVCCSRPRFLGPQGDRSRPAALRRRGLGEASDCLGDACAAFQIELDIAPGESVECHFVLGQGADAGEAAALAERWRDADRVEAEFKRLKEQWRERLGAVQVSTPDASFDLMINRWLPYQTRAARLDARAGFYQAGGGIGFRDQLQDVLALLHGDPATARRHILRAAEAQFEEGDVLHWWHPPEMRGVRTRITDDLLWLPYVSARYVEATGDSAILSEALPYLRAPELEPDEHDRFAVFEPTQERWPLLDHCERALERAHRLGADGLPLIGTGDWNDGMDRIGARGRGQSVWLGWFLIAAIDGFLELCEGAEHTEPVTRWQERREELRRAVEESGWDGAWYLRAIDDDGEPWGSAANEECRIDSIAQSWAVLSGAGEPARAQQALNAAARELMPREGRIVRLLTPPFDTTHRDPGYIRSYPPGIRENGGQYSHAAAWLGIAFALSGDGDRAREVFDRLNPALHATTPEEARRYLTEPYAMAADIGGAAPHVGRGGWSWYTGAAAWGWRLGVEYILGLQPRPDGVEIRPCLPGDWEGFSARLERDGAVLEIRCRRVAGLDPSEMRVSVDGSRVVGARIGFPAAGTTRKVELEIAPAVAPARISERPVDGHS